MHSKVIYSARNRSQASPKAGEKKLKVLKREREARIFNQSMRESSSLKVRGETFAVVEGA
ncbi:MAG: hypothetical protein QNJ65_00880 [Xenococcaceae cyanobacterium MO_234.B1]|nr:hypothetical protein [Xenococcaceae cyanobacterium MO_234.B1]